jgi:GNAT superfamily N-acetyltransferase
MVVAGQQHFFSEAPVLRWISWLWRNVWPLQNESPPSLVSLDDFRTQQIRIPTGITLKRTTKERAHLYVAFLASYYSTIKDSYQLVLPLAHLQKWIESQFLIGIEAVDAQNHLVGIVWSSSGGTLLESKTSMITWFCIHPLWRGTGVANALLRTIVYETPTRQIHWWRTDGLLKSPIPPMYTQKRMTRQRRTIRSTIGTVSLRVEKQPLSKWISSVQASWSKAHATGILLKASHEDINTTSTEVWVMRTPGQHQIALVVQPTFERHRQTGLPWCEVLWWISEGQTNSTDYSLALNIEAMLDTLPYGWFDAPSALPHVEDEWVPTRDVSWSVLGLDPGSPVQRSVVSITGL